MRLFIFCMRMKGFGASECCASVAAHAARLLRPKQQSFGKDKRTNKIRVTDAAAAAAAADVACLALQGEIL